jgi:hypothetical protein
MYENVVGSSLLNATAFAGSGVAVTTIVSLTDVPATILVTSMTWGVPVVVGPQAVMIMLAMANRPMAVAKRFELNIFFLPPN